MIISVSRALLATAVQHSAFAAVTNRAFLRVSGSDATRWLNGMVTNSAQALVPGQGNYNFLLNAQGRIQADCFVFREIALPDQPATFLLATDGAQLPALQAHLERFIIMDDVELSPAYGDESSLLLLGPEAARHLAEVGLPAPGPLQLYPADSPAGTVLLFRHPGAMPRFELRASAGVLQAMAAGWLDAGVTQLEGTALEGLRVLEGVPRFGTDIRDRELPQETAQTHALHFSKGCYLGQEIVERIHSRGQVHRTFTGFRLVGEPPALPTALEAGGKAVGELTSVVRLDSTEGSEWLALGYCRREALETRAELTYPGGTAVERDLPGTL